MSAKISRRGLLLAGAAAGAGTTLLRSARAQQPRANISTTAGRPDKPNIVLIVIDTLRRDHIGIYGNDRIRTPSLDHLGSQSLRFTNSVPEAMPTIPARRSIHTGMRTFPFRNWHRRAGNGTSVWGWQHIPDEQPTLAEQMSEGGYETLLVSDVAHEFKAGMNFSRGFNTVHWIRGQEGDNYQPYWASPTYSLERYMFRTASGKELAAKSGYQPLRTELRQYLANNIERATEEDYLAPKVFRAAAQVLEKIPGDKPFFLSVDSFDPHEPWDPPQPYVYLYDDPDFDGPEPISPSYGSSDYLTEKQLRRMRALYAAELTMTDRWLGFFLESLESSGLLDSTFVILTSDHGMALGEHGAVGKPAFALWSEMTNTPHFIRHPNGTAAGATNDYFASTHDVAPTILAIAGIEPRTQLDGTSLLPALDGKEPEAKRDHFTTGLNNFVWASDKRYNLIATNKGEKAKLYDISIDPDQNNDIAGSSPEIVERMFGLVLEDAGGEELPQYED